MTGPTTLADAATALRVDRSEAAMRDVIITAPGASAEHVAALAVVLASSGASVPRCETAADVASTGGPGSLTTLLTSPLLVSAGWSVPKIGVPGRPAGGIDALGSLQGFRVDLDAREFASVLATAGHAHVRAGGVWAPLDAALFALRRRTGAQAVHELAAASLLSKKIAAGVGRAVLDVRVAPHGNFGDTVEAARTSARLFVDAAAACGITAIAVLSDASAPRQPWIGRGEALVALRDAIDGTADGALAGHAADCAELAATVPGAPPPSRGAARAALAAHLAAQGSDERTWRDRAAAVAAAERVVVTAPSDGHVRFNMAKIRDALVAEQAAATAPTDTAYPDPSGVVLLAMAGVTVAAGAPVLAVRRDGADPRPLADQLAAAVNSGPADSVAGRPEWHGETVS